jgi:hypothetical protein
MVSPDGEYSNWWRGIRKRVNIPCSIREDFDKRLFLNG